MNILMIGGLVPWHPEAGGGQIIAYKLAEALAKKRQKISYIAIATKEYQREIGWADFIYLKKPEFISQFLQSFKNQIKGHDLVHLHIGSEVTGFCLGYGLRNLFLSGRLILSVYPPRVYGVPRSFSEACWISSCLCADAIFSLSEYSRRNISKAYHIPSSKVKAVYAGVDESFISKGEKIKKNDNFSLLFCGRLNGPREQKGVDVLLKSLPIILKQHTVTLKIVGSGAKLDKYIALTKELKIEKHVVFSGFVEHEKLPGYYSEADLFVLPSRKESFGLVLAEAMASGLPVVSTNVTAIPEVVKNGENGILVPPNDPERFAEAVNSLLDNPERMRRMGMKGRERVRENFTWDKVAERVLKYYEEIL